MIQADIMPHSKHSGFLSVNSNFVLSNEGLSATRVITFKQSESQYVACGYPLCINFLSFLQKTKANEQIILHAQLHAPSLCL